MGELVSIITPTFNSAKYIEKTIRSVQNQTYQDWEMIIVDDCSTDETYNIVRKIAKADMRIHIFEQDKNAGAAMARNRALDTSSGRFIAYLDADRSEERRVGKECRL